MDVLMPNVSWPEVTHALMDTVLMVANAFIFTVFLALPLGVLMYLTSSSNLHANSWLYRVLSFIINIVRSVPFIILLITVLP